MAQGCYVEIDEQASWVATQAKVRQHLCYVKRLDVVDRLQLDDDFVCHEKVDSIRAVDELATVVDIDRDLAAKGHVTERKLTRETMLIR